MATIIQLRRDTAARWTASNPILAQGEAGLETDTNKLKFGDGVTAWNSLAYFGPAAPVTSVNTKTGAVVLDASDVGAVPTARTVNSKALSSDITLSAGDVGAVPTSRTINSKALSSDVTLAAGDVGAVPTTRTVNNKELSSDITLNAGDVGALSDVQVDGTSIVTDGVANIPVASQDTLGVAKVSPTYGLTVSNGIIVGSTKTASVYSTAANSLTICKGTLDNIKNDFVRSVLPACTTITAADTTATLVANTTYAHQPATGCTYTLTTPSDLTVYSGFILVIETTNSASIAFQTDDSPATTISISGSPTIEVGKKYTVTGQWDVLNSSWQLFIISYEAS